MKPPHLLAALAVLTGLLSLPVPATRADLRPAPGLVPQQPAPVPEAGPKPPTPWRPPGLWTQATTIAFIPGKVLTERQLQWLQQSRDMDEVLACFNLPEVQALLRIAFETGSDLFLEAKGKVRQPVPLPDKPHLLLTFDVITIKFRNNQLGYRPLYTLRFTKLQNPTPSQQNQFPPQPLLAPVQQPALPPLQQPAVPPAQPPAVPPAQGLPENR